MPFYLPIMQVEHKHKRQDLFKSEKNPNKTRFYTINITFGTWRI